MGNMFSFNKTKMENSSNQRTFSWVKINQTWTLQINNTLFGQSFDRETILKRLAGKNILIIGDSLTRYQYLNLVYFLATGSWVSPLPSNEIEGVWGEKTDTSPALSYNESWQRFYHEVSTKRLATSTTYELCDCQRFKIEKTFFIQEGRYFREVKNHINIDYFFENKGMPPALGNYLKSIEPPQGCDPGKGECRQRLCEPGQCYPPTNGWTSANHNHHNLDALLRQVLFMNNLSYKYDIAFLSDDGIKPYTLEAARRAFEIIRSAGIKTVIWKPTLPAKRNLRQYCNNSMTEDMKAYNISQQGWNLFDFSPLLCLYLRTTNHSTYQVYYDAAHLQPGFNTALNYLLLDILGFL